ncbi:sulfotransferase family 2 domain-containing protein [Maridesulfovibrio sp.]|uniref:sulfotransferase family 2 domain-containing protein n=1 Tax=Maridesulfovibrio sp. TaxID=2795000 RepID=UPI002A18E52B|nr:sulfotransferase family 2 domain-containing protein [Maridesulfovibrio sp.]
MHSPFFFLHIPKTAGTTLNHIFAAKFPEETICSVYTKEENEFLKKISAEELDRINLVQGHIFVHDFDEFFSGFLGKYAFTFLREPVARVVSEYNFLRTWPENHLYRYLNDEKVSLIEYVSSLRPELIYRGKNLMTRSLCGAVEDGRSMLERAKDNLQRLYLFGITERFDESLLMLKRMMNLENVLYEKHNVRKKRSTVTEEELDVIREYNCQDIELYEFASCLFEQRVNDMGDEFKNELSFFKKMNERYQRIANLLMQQTADDDKDFIYGK